MPVIEKLIPVTNDLFTLFAEFHDKEFNTIHRKKTVQVPKCNETVTQPPDM